MIDTTHLKGKDPKDPFGDLRDDVEQRLARRLGRALSQQERNVLVAMGWPPDISRLDGYFWQLELEAMQFLADELAEAALGAAQIATVAGFPIEVDWSLFNQDAIAWANAYNFELVSGINETAQYEIRQALGGFIETYGMTRGEFEALLAPTFGTYRAEMIAVTEATRALYQGNRLVVDQAAEFGISMEGVWRTNRDDQVCDLCWPLDGKPETIPGSEVWMHPVMGPVGPPPGHPRCRCWATYQMVEGALEAMEEQAEVQELVQQVLPTAPVEPTVEQQIEQTLRDFESVIHTQQYESALLVSKCDGSVLHRQDGEQYQVEFSSQIEQSCQRLRDIILTHNHPRGWDYDISNPLHLGNAFSDDDLLVAVNFDLAEARAISRGYLHSIQRPENGWPEYGRARAILKEQELDLRRYMAGLINRGEIPVDLANATHYHELTQRYAREVGAVYERIPIEDWLSEEVLSGQ